MDMPPIHMCAYLSHENERLKTKIADLKRHVRHLEQRIASKDHDHARSCSISCQTDIAAQPRSTPPTGQHPSEEQMRLHRLLKSQNDLLKKYENEASQDHRVPVPNGRVAEYERRLAQCEREKEQAEQRAVSAQKRMEKFEERYERMKKEIGALDENFFDEIEDLKYALQQANDLNREYERTVQMLSTRLGIPYPKIVEKRKQ
jgi:chromosome segregation ATPase